MPPEATFDFIRLLNAALAWTTDDSMLSLVPPDARTFEGPAGWPKRKALTYLHNNVEVLRRNYVALETGTRPDTAELNPVLETVRLRLQPFAKEERLRLVPGLLLGEFNPGTAAVRLIVQRAYYAFARYVEHRLSDLAWPAATPFRVRILGCSLQGCEALAASPDGAPRPCAACSAELDPRR